MNILATVAQLIITMDGPSTIVAVLSIAALTLSVRFKVRIGKWLRIKARVDTK